MLPRKVITFVLSMLLSSTALANPTGGIVAAGSAVITQSNSNTVIQQTSQKVIVNWQSFNIGPTEKTHFQQPQGGIALNRISATQGPSQIYGQLTATGKIILVNQAGIFFGPGSYVNVGGIIASTANITDQNFLTGKWVFDQPSPFNGAIINKGNIIAAQHGLVALLGNSVSNDGLIQARTGNVVLASGNKFTVDLYGDQLIQFTVDDGITLPGQDENGKPMNTAVENSGTIIADDGTILMTAKTAANIVDHAINMSGVAEARSVSQGNGMIILSADGGEVNVSGKIDASGAQLGTKGGEIKVLGDNIHLTTTASLDASGNIGGGEILIGGNYQGKGPEKNALQTTVDAGAVVKADAINNGNGGRIIVWADQDTYFHGNISATGGMQGGNGGFVETSGHRYLDVKGIQINLKAPFGENGTWLLDPADVTISTDPSNNIVLPVCSGGICTPTSQSDTSIVNTTDLENALATSDVTITTTNTGTAGNGTGIIRVENEVSWTSPSILTLTAADSISFSSGANITTPNGGLVLNAGTSLNSINDAGGGYAIVVGAGGLKINSNAVLNGAIGGTGAVTINANFVTLTGNNAYSGGTIINATGGNLVALTVASDASLGAVPSTLQTSNIHVTGGGSNAFLYLDGTLNPNRGILIDSGNLSFGNNLTINAPISGGGGVTYAPGYNFSVGGTNTYTGATSINGTVTLTNASAIPTADSVNNTGVLNINGLNISIGGPVFSSFSSGSIINLDSGSLTFTGNVVSNGTIAGNGEIDVNAPSSTVIFNGGHNTFNGIVNIAAGTLQISSDADLGMVPTQPANTIFISDLNGDLFNNTSTVTLNANRQIVIGPNGGVISAGSSPFIINGTIDGAGPLSLSLTGNITLNGAIGNVTPLTFITTTSLGGSILTIGANSITTTGSQTYNRPVVLNAALTLTSQNGNGISFSNTIDGAQSLNIANDSGNVTFGGVIGGTTPLASLTIGTGYTIALNTTAITTSGAQVYNSVVTLEGNLKLASLSAGGITFNNILNGAQTLTIANNSGKITFTGNISGLTGLSIGSGNPTWLPPNVTTVGSQTYNGVTSSNSQTTLIATGASSDIIIGGSGSYTLDGYPLSLSAGDSIFINGPISLTSSGLQNNLSLSAVNNIVINNSISLLDSGIASGTLLLSAGTGSQSITTGSAGTINVDNFNLLQGQWYQDGILPAFSVNNNFQINSGNMPNAGTQFLRALNGDGSSGAPYILSDIYGLQGIGSNTNLLNKYYQLNNTIDASLSQNWNGGAGFIPIGNTANNFTGSFDGNNNIISNLVLHVTNNIASDIGLFGDIGGSASISNVGVTGANIYVSSTQSNSQVNMGILVGNATSSTTSITNAYTTGSITNTSGAVRIGGLVGSNSATLTQAYTTAAVNVNYDGSTFSNIGGLAGLNFGGKITQSYAYAPVTVTLTGSSSAPIQVGGLIGANFAVANNSYSMGNVIVSGNNSNLQVGGFSGLNTSNITQSYSIGAVVSSAGTVNGFVGYNNNSSAKITNSFWDTGTSGQSVGATDANGARETNLTGGCFSGGSCPNGGSANLSASATFSDSPYSWDFTTIWGNIEGRSYPYLLAIYPTLPRAISGGSSASVNSDVVLSSSGSTLDTVKTFANGAYYFLEKYGALSNNIPILLYLTGSTTKANAVTVLPRSGGSLTNATLAANTLQVGDDNANIITNDTLATALGALNSSDILYSVSSNNLTLGTASHLTTFLQTSTNTSYIINGTISTVSGGTSGLNLLGITNINSNSISTTGSQVYGGMVSLVSNTTLASTGGSNMTFNSAIVGNGNSLVLNAGSSGVISAESFNSTGDLTVTNSGGTSFSGTVTAGTVTLNNTAGNILFNGTLLAANLVTTAQGYGVQLNAGSSITAATTFLNTGGVTFAGNNQLMNGVSTSALTTLAGDITTNNAIISLNPTGTVNLTGVSQLTGSAITLGDVVSNSGAFDLSLANTDASTIRHYTESGAGGGSRLIKTGTGLLTLSNANTYSGGTTIQQGSVGIENAAGLGTGMVSVASGAALFVENTLGTITNALDLAGNGSGTGALVNTGNNTFSGTIALSGDTTVSNAGSITLYTVTGNTHALTLTGDANNNTFILNGPITDTRSFTVDGGSSGRDAIDLSSITTARTVTLSSSGSAHGLAGSIDYDGMLFNNIDAINVNSTANNTLIGTNAASEWTISSANAGTYTSTSSLTFNHFQTILGGTGNDTFSFMPGSSLTQVDGGAGGINTLNYSQYGSAVQINLQTATANGLTGTFNRINQVIGDNTYHGTLTAANGLNVWNITGTNSGNVTGLSNGFSQMSYLIGGSTDANTFHVSSGASVTGGIDGGNTIAVNAITFAEGVKLNLTSLISGHIESLSHSNSIADFTRLQKATALGKTGYIFLPDSQGKTYPVTYYNSPLNTNGEIGDPFYFFNFIIGNLPPTPVVNPATSNAVTPTSLAFLGNVPLTVYLTNDAGITALLQGVDILNKEVQEFVSFGCFAPIP